MSLSARLLYIALKARYSFTLRNNGRIYLSVRQAAKEINLNKSTIVQAFRELQHYGFIVMTSGG
jgi:DNA-binding transcriptional regulator YhcF (GntR family)